MTVIAMLVFMIPIKDYHNDDEENNEDKDIVIMMTTTAAIILWTFGDADDKKC
jgi:hypothetical protein